MDFHPALAHCFRFWSWLTTAMVTKEWVAIHRKHHAHCETELDPHSPQVFGIGKLVWGGTELYMAARSDEHLLSQFGQRHARGLDRTKHLHAALQLGTDGTRCTGDRAVRRRRNGNLGHPDDVDSFLGRRCRQRRWTLVGLPQLRNRGPIDQSVADCRLGRRRGTAQQSSRVPEFGEIFGSSIRIRSGVARYPDTRKAQARPTSSAWHL